MATTSPLSLTSALGADALTPVALRAEEGISVPFRFLVDVVANEPALDPDKLLAKPACVTHTARSGFVRHFSGIVRSLRALDMQGRNGWRYQLELVPQFWFACQTADCRVFHQLSGLDIVKKVLEENKVTISDQTTAPGPKRDFTVQYNETDYDFVVRLLEEEGCFWFFEHSSGAHKLVLGDGNTVFSNAGEPTLSVVPSGESSDVLSSFTRATATAIGKVTLADYDPLRPATPVTGEQQTVLKTTAAATRDVWRWPALTAVADLAKTRARLREEAAEAAATLCHGAGSNASLMPGRKFTIKQDRLTGLADTPYIVRWITHEVLDDSDVAGAATDSYTNHFEAFPAATKWRDMPHDRRPAMSGIHSAVVLGNSGEEIHTDKYGRIKVRFFWDHRKDATADTTIFVRLMEPWSGNGWGWQHLPRVGSEVAVAFVNGDPDSPIIVGSLYNAEQMPPFALPDQQTKTGLRTRSTQKGGTADYSELSFDDKKGSELVFLHAQKDYTEEVENDHLTHVKHDQTLKVDNTQTIKIGNGRAATILKADDTLKISQGNLSVEASMGKIDHVSMSTYSIKSKTDSVKINALVSIELTVGANSIKIDQSGVAINGVMVKVAGTAMLDMKAPMTSLKGDGMLMLKGGLTMVN